MKQKAVSVKKVSEKNPKKKGVKKVAATKNKKLSINKSETKKDEPKKFSITLQLGTEQPIVTKGNSITECLEQIKPPFLKSKGIFTISNGVTTAQKAMYPFEIRRLLSGLVSKIVFDKRMTAMMK